MSETNIYTLEDVGEKSRALSQTTGIHRVSVYGSPHDLAHVLDRFDLASADKLSTALVAGKVDGASYSTCLGGTLVRAKYPDVSDAEHVTSILCSMGLLYAVEFKRPESDFFSIIVGDTPDDSVAAALYYDWTQAYLRDRMAALTL